MLSILMIAAVAPVLAEGPAGGHPLATLRTMEIEDLEREIKLRHDTVLLKRAHLATSQQMVQKGLVSTGELERETAGLRDEEAREAEALARRALKIYERDVQSGAMTADDDRAYTLLLEWLKAREAIAQAELDYRSYVSNQTRNLYQRNTIGRRELEDAVLAENTAQAAVALYRSREAEVELELAALRGEPAKDPAAFHRRKSALYKARVSYREITAAGAKARFDTAVARSKLGRIRDDELPAFRKAVEEAETALEADRRALENHTAEPPTRKNP